MTDNLRPDSHASDLRATLADYDAWRLQGPDEESDAIGTDEGQLCNRVHEPDEDAPRGYRPRPCAGEMEEENGVLICDRCGEVA